MESLVNRAMVDPEGVARLMEEDYGLVIGDALVGLRLLANEPIDTFGLDTRSVTVLRRMRCETWSNLSERPVGDIWRVPAAGRLTVKRILSAAALRNAAALRAVASLEQQGSADLGTEGDGPAPAQMEIVERRRAGAARLDRVVQDLAAWAIRERGASRLSDLLSLSPDLGRVPSEISAEFARLNDFPLNDFVVGVGSALSEELLSDFLDTVGPRADVLIARKIRLGRRATLEDLGGGLGVSRERVRQVEAKAVAAAQAALASDTFAPVRWRASDLRDVLGVAVLEDSELLNDALNWALRGLTPPELCDASELMLWIAGPYERESGWLVQCGFSLAALRREFGEQLAGSMLINIETAQSILENLGVSAQMSTEFVEQAPGWRALNGDTFVRWPGALGDKAEVVLKLVARPCSIDEVNAHIGEGHAASSLRTVLAGDPRFVRLDKASNFGLAEWGFEEYAGIAQEIIERVERSGGSADLEEVVSELVISFGVSATSVRMYAGSPAFVISNGRVALRSADNPYKPDDRIERVKGLYVAADGRVVVHAWVDKDVLRGSGRQLPEAAAAAMGICPGDRVEFGFSGDAQIVVSWPATSVMGPTVGSVRAIATKLELGIGDRFRVVFDPTTRTCTAEAVDDATIGGLTGLSVEPGQELATLAAALQVDPHTVRSLLQARGDDEVLSLLPPVDTSPDLGDAITAFGNLLGG